MDLLRTFLATHSKVFQELTEDATVDELLTGYECDRTLLERLPALYTDNLKLSNCLLDATYPYDSIANCTEDQLRMLLDYIDYLDLPKDLEEKLNELLKNGKDCEKYTVDTIVGDVQFDKTNCSHWAVIGDIRGLQWAREEQNYNWDDTTYVHACGPYGSLDCLKYAFANQCPLSENVKRLNHMAGKHNTLDYLQCLHEKGVLNRYASYYAAFIGNLENLRFIHKSGIPLVSHITYFAATNGHLHILKYAYEHKCNWHTKTCRQAVTNGHFDCMRYAYENGAPLPINLYELAIEQNSLECIKFMYEIGLEIPDEICVDAVSNGNLEMLKFCHKKGAKLGQDVYLYALQDNNLECLRYVHETGIKFGKSICVIAKYKNTECSEYVKASPEWQTYELNATT